mmetsp:Transcript_28091/g.61499  ORF Transcript_28091/g.61499 Transcript_28091/m.61499 type:complete len:329 (+) Transcript_28091:406-1392(+)
MRTCRRQQVVGHRILCSEQRHVLLSEHINLVVLFQHHLLVRESHRIWQLVVLEGGEGAEDAYEHRPVPEEVEQRLRHGAPHQVPGHRHQRAPHRLPALVRVHQRLRHLQAPGGVEGIPEEAHQVGPRDYVAGGEARVQEDGVQFGDVLVHPRVQPAPPLGQIPDGLRLQTGKVHSPFLPLRVHLVVGHHLQNLSSLVVGAPGRGHSTPELRDVEDVMEIKDDLPGGVGRLLDSLHQAGHQEGVAVHVQFLRSRRRPPRHQHHAPRLRYVRPAERAQLLRIALHVHHVLEGIRELRRGAVAGARDDDDGGVLREGWRAQQLHHRDELLP